MSGGSAGHSSLWALDIEEGPSGLPRHWKVTVSTPSEVCEENEAKKAVPLRERILEAAGRFPDGNTMSVILATAAVKHDKKASAFMETLVKEGALVHKKVEKKGVVYDRFSSGPGGVVPQTRGVESWTCSILSMYRVVGAGSAPRLLPPTTCFVGGVCRGCASSNLDQLRNTPTQHDGKSRCDRVPSNPANPSIWWSMAWRLESEL